MGLDTCRSCPRVTTVDPDAIHCTPAPGVVAPAGAPVGSDACVGEAMGIAAFAVDACLPAASLARALDAPGHRAAVVVDDALRSLGLIEIAAAGGAFEDCSVGELLRRVSPIHEGAPLAEAIERMVHERARALPVVDHRGTVVGLLTDLDALHWVAHRDPRRDDR